MLIEDLVCGVWVLLGKGTVITVTISWWSAVVRVNTQFRRDAILTVVAYFATHSDPFWRRISLKADDKGKDQTTHHLGASKVPSTT